MADFLGHSNNFATLSLSLSLSLSQALASNTSIKNRGHPRVNIRFFLEPTKGGRIVFCPPCSGGQAAMTRQQIYFNNIINKLNPKN